MIRNPMLPAPVYASKPRASGDDPDGQDDEGFHGE